MPELESAEPQAQDSPQPESSALATRENPNAMGHHFALLVTISVFSLYLGGCAGTATVTPPPPTLPSSTSTATSPAPSDTPGTAVRTYRDDSYGFTFDYPADWMVDAVTLGDRAPAAYQLTSWKHEPGMVSEVPPGGTIMNIGIQRWDPKGDLDAYVAQRKSAWVASGLTLSAEEEIMLANGNRAMVGVVTEPQEGQGYFLFTVLGEDYLFATGDGDVESLALVARSIR